MANVVLVDISDRGHRSVYIEALYSKDECVVLIPSCTNLHCDYIPMRCGFDKRRSWSNYWNFIREINKTVADNKAKIVHILCGDAIYRFFGFGLNRINAQVIVTFHHMTFGYLKRHAISNIFRRVKTGVVHTQALYDRLIECGVKNVAHIEYPSFNIPVDSTVEESRNALGIKTNKKVVGIIGGTQAYKGLSVLLDALSFIETDFFLYVCGVERDYSREQIIQSVKPFLNDYLIDLRFLSDSEYSHALNAVDILLLPYVAEFDGASGPLADSVYYRKEIIGSNHGSLGSTIADNHLGATFTTGNSNNLAVVLDAELCGEFLWDEVAESYRLSLDVASFLADYKMLYGCQ